MTSAETKKFRVMFDLTKQHIARGEEYVRSLSQEPQSVVRDKLIDSTVGHIDALQKEADELERLGWGNGNA